MTIPAKTVKHAAFIARAREALIVVDYVRDNLEEALVASSPRELSDDVARARGWARALVDELDELAVGASE